MFAGHRALISVFAAAAAATATFANAEVTGSDARASSSYATTVEYTVAHTKLGDVRGAVRSYGNMTVREFLGIRYAQSPTGGLRFSKPLPVQPWSPQTYDALSLGSSCPHTVRQRPSQQPPQKEKDAGGAGLVSEDCLFLNVYAPFDGSLGVATASSWPQPSPPSAAQQRAVMVFVHGGGFETGSSSEYTGSGLASLGDVVVVTLNYRLTVFGYLSTGGPDARGNYGLWDQRTALVWVRDNVAAFGGDPTRVTVFGQSAGAASVHYQAISPQNDQTVFQRVIAESGSYHAPWAFQYEPLTPAVGIAKRLACPTAPSASLVACLRSKSMDELMANADGLGWAPSVDGEFVLDTPDVMTRKVLNGSRDAYLENFSKYDYLTGFNSQEALMFVDAPMVTPSINDISKNLTGKDITDGLTDEVYSYGIKLMGQFNYYDDSSVALFVNYVKLLYENIYRQQLDSYPPDAKDMLRLIVQITGDFELVAPTIQALKLHATLNGTGRSYEYVYDVRRSFDVPRTLFWEGPDWLRTGADHADELGSVFAYPFLQGFLPNGSFVPTFNYTEAERELSAAVIQYWTNYAKNGNPSIGKPLLKSWDAWSTYDINERSFLYIRVNGSTSSSNAKPQEDFFWNDLVAFSRNRFQASSITSEARNCVHVTTENDGDDVELYVVIVSVVAAFAFICTVAVVVLWRKLRLMQKHVSRADLPKGYFQQLT